MSIWNLFGGGSGAGGIEIDGNGYVVRRDGQWLGRDVIGVFPHIVQNGDGVGGPLIHRTAPQRVLAAGKVDGTLTTDQPLTVLGAEEYVVRSVIFTAASTAPVAMEGGVYTRYGKSGHVLVPASTSFAALDEPRKVLEVSVDVGETVSAPFIYVSLSIANDDPIEVECYVIGDVLRYAQS